MLLEVELMTVTQRTSLVPATDLPVAGGGLLEAPPAMCDTQAMIVIRPSRRRKAIGIGCLFMGPIGLILPVVPGFIFVGLGTFILRDQYVWAYRSVGAIDRRWPQLIPGIEAREEKAMAWGDRQIDKAKRVFRRD